ncbi:MAG: hypothetical protein RJA52_1484 [Bacteroidota bacterium]
MSIYLAISDRDTGLFKSYLTKYLPDYVKIFEYNEKHKPDDIEMIIAWKHPLGLFKAYKNVKLISSMGAGVEHLINDPDLPTQAILSRVVDPQLTLGMQRYVVWAVIHLLKNIPIYTHQKNGHIWQTIPENNLYQSIGILGMGVLGSACALSLKKLGFDVKGYSKFPKKIEEIEVFDSFTTPLNKFATQCGIAICLLPSTQDNYEILNESFFNSLPKGAGFINPGRGSQVNETDLMKVLNNGQLSHAILDVFKEEPLSEDHLFWDHPNISITPHIASISNPDSTSKILAESYLRVKQGLSPHYEVNREKGY